MKIILATLALAIIASASPAGAEQASERCDADASALGRKVLAVQAAIAEPTAPGAADAIKVLGLDSRYYVMVRGWLSMQLAGDRSIANARGDATPQHIQVRIHFLEQAIRAIDLE